MGGSIAINYRKNSWFPSMGLPSGNLTVCDIENGPFIVDLPVENDDFP